MATKNASKTQSAAAAKEAAKAGKLKHAPAEAPAKVASRGARKAADAEAPAKGKGKAGKAEGQGQSGQQGQRGPRGQYAGKKITVTAEGKAAAPRGNRGARWELVKAAKTTDDVLGKAYTRADGAEGTITSAGLRNFVDRGFITLA